jgi:2,3-bisphosphoglycerate-independent phosphoglycerate mutase
VKLIYLVLDGVADKPEDGPTSLELANKPFLDKVASLSRCGLMYTVGKGIAPESDAAVMSILGYDPHKEYTGRGPVEAVGAGLELREGYEVAFRANFATIDPKTRKILDRRCGRNLSSEEAHELAKAVDGLELGVYDGYARVVATVGHRAVVIIGSKTHRVSDNVSNTDPAYEKHGYVAIAKSSFEPYVAEAKPLDGTEEARIMATLVNKFTEKIIQILKDHPVNQERIKKGKMPANVILLRDSGGRLPRLEEINKKFGLRFGAVAEMPVEIGIARILKMDMESVPPPTEDKAEDYKIRLEATMKLLERNDVVYVHLKGPDEPGHDGDMKRKVESIELIDRYYVGPLLEQISGKEIALLVTADHATPYTRKSHTDDPVPVVLMLPRNKQDGLKRLTEKECSKGSLGVFQHGYELLPRILEMIKSP